MNSDFFQKIKSIIDQDVNAVLKKHHGFVILAGIEEKEVLEIILEFHGACVGCPLQYSSTLRMIENILKSKMDGQNFRVLNSMMIEDV